MEIDSARELTARLVERLSADGVTGTGSTPQELAEYIKSESGKWSKVVRDAGIKLN